MRTIIFDFDGTIADTVSVGVAAFNTLAAEYGFTPITDANSDQLRSRGPRAVMRELSVPMLRVPLVLRTLRREVRRALPHIAAIEGVSEALVELRSAGYRIGILTSNTHATVQKFISDHGMGNFDFIEGGISLFGKKRAIRRVMAREAMSAAETIFVGDEMRDVEAAKANGIRVIAVTWGINSGEGLAAAGADYVVNSAGEILRTVERIW